MCTPSLPACAFVVTDRGKLARLYLRYPQNGKMFAFKASKAFSTNRPELVHSIPYELTMRAFFQCHGNTYKFAEMNWAPSLQQDA